MHICYNTSMTKPVYNVRIDPELYELLAPEAKAQGRSITSQVNFMLRVALVRGLTRPPVSSEEMKRRFERSRERSLARKAKKD